MQVLQGIAVSPGVAIGEAVIIDQEGFRIPQRFVPLHINNIKVGVEVLKHVPSTSNVRITRPTIEGREPDSFICVFPVLDQSKLIFR